MISGFPACSCLENYIGPAPNCRPECVLSSECPSQQACIQQQCKDPCPGSCGFEASKCFYFDVFPFYILNKSIIITLCMEIFFKSNTFSACHVLSHLPICTCNDGYEGDPFVRCQPKVITESPPVDRSFCSENPCGPNAECVGNECRCIAEYQGNPYEGCRPECSTNAECNRDLACLRNKCTNPCRGTCGQHALCEVVNHIPICSCPPDYTGDPFSNCHPAPPISKIDVCNPSPCGVNIIEKKKKKLFDINNLFFLYVITLSTR